MFQLLFLKTHTEICETSAHKLLGKSLAGQ